MTLPMMANNPGCSENSQQKNEVFVKYNKKKNCSKQFNQMHPCHLIKYIVGNHIKDEKVISIMQSDSQSENHLYFYCSK
jgi:hypothetical protein